MKCEIAIFFFFLFLVNPLLHRRCLFQSCCNILRCGTIFKKSQSINFVISVNNKSLFQGNDVKCPVCFSASQICCFSLFSISLHHHKLNIFGYWAVGRTQQTICRWQFRVEEISVYFSWAHMARNNVNGWLYSTKVLTKDMCYLSSKFWHTVNMCKTEKLGCHTQKAY